MGKHRKDMPVTGTGKSYGNGPKPKRGQVSVTTASGSIIWKATAGLFGRKKGAK